MREKPHLKKKTLGLIRVRPSRQGHWSTHPVDRVLPGCCTGRSFNKSRPIQPSGRPAGPGLITVLLMLRLVILNFFY
jgi:hypothetical protein